MNARAISIASRAIRSSPRCFALRTPVQRRFASSEQRHSNISQFYKTFTRPVAKVLLLAFFTYQLAYWAWVKLEQDEIMAQREAYIAELEEEIAWLTSPDPRVMTEELKQNHGGREPTLQEYQLQLKELERRNKEVLKAIAQAEFEEKYGQDTTSQKKTSPWWKVW